LLPSLHGMNQALLLFWRKVIAELDARKRTLGSSLPFTDAKHMVH